MASRSSSSRSKAAGSRVGSKVGPKAGSKVGSKAANGRPGKESRGTSSLAKGEARLTALARAATERGIAGLLVTNPIDVGYLTGFHGGDSYLFVGAGRPIIISDFRYQEELTALASIAEIVIRSGPITEATAKVIMDRGVQRVGVQAEHMTLGVRQGISLKAKGVKLIETTGLIAQVRQIKDDDEVASIRRAVKIQQEAMEATLEYIDRTLRKSGSVREDEIGALLEFEMKKRGADKPSFETNVSAGAHGSLPHYRAGATALRANQALLIDWGAVAHGYHADMTRVFCWGKWPAKIREIYQIVLDAHELAASALRAGVTNHAVDKAAREHIVKHGYGEQFGHSLGHGIGLNIHEGPTLASKGEPLMLQAGQVVTIEPGIYLPGVGGVRLENDYLVTPTGAKNLCSMPMDLAWATR